MFYSFDYISSDEMYVNFMDQDLWISVKNSDTCCIERITAVTQFKKYERLEHYKGSN